jgi:hypothetical protein
VHRDKLLSDHLDLILKRPGPSHVSEGDLTDADYAVVSKAFGIDDVLDAILAAASGEDVDWSFYEALPDATRQLLAEGGRPTLESLQEFAASLSSESSPA